MTAATMTKAERDAAILGSFALLELDGQLDSAVEELEEIAGPHRLFELCAGNSPRQYAIACFDWLRRTCGPHVQAAMLKVIRIGRELVDAERAELQSPVTPEEIQKRKDVERFAKFLQEDIAKPVMQSIADVWYAPKVRA